MKFKERELKPYAEPVSALKLKKGSVYFSVTYVDDEMHFPIVDTMVFVGKDDSGLLQFQDVESYRSGISSNSSVDIDKARSTFYRCSENQTNNIFEFEYALEELMKCSIRRQRKKKI